MPRTAHRGILTVNDLKLRCVIDEITGCWHWRGAVNSQGTPVTYLPVLDTTVSLGIALCRLTTGQRPAAGAIWFPKCGNSLCANPQHRRAGTRSDTTRGTRTATHTAKATLARRARAKVTPEIAAAIRASDEPRAVLAARHGISLSHAYRIHRGENWMPVAAVGSSVFNFGG